MWKYDLPVLTIRAELAIMSSVAAGQVSGRLPTHVHSQRIMEGEGIEKLYYPSQTNITKQKDVVVCTFSIAIIRYVSRKFGVPENWYPQDIEKQARVDEYLEWQHHNTRAFCALFFLEKRIKPLLTGEEASPEKLAKLQKNMEKCLDSFEELWLSGGPFIVGDQITVADLIAACEIEQPRMAGYEPRVGRPKLEAWLERVRNATNPYYDEAHKIVEKMSDSSKAKL